VPTSSFSDAALRAFVVRIDSTDHAHTLGSGVLVANGWVLTAAHVLAGRETVTVVPDRGARARDNAEPPTRVNGHVKARSDDPDPSSPSKLWPFPDLALLQTPEWTDHPFAPLDDRSPSSEGHPHAWGYGEREAGVTAVGAASTYTFAGVDGDGFLSLSAGEATPGLSGAPLICPIRRAVVGIMTATREAGSARGGWAGPISALSTISDPNGELNSAKLVLSENQSNRWLHRDLWSKALTIEDAGRCLDQPWLGLEQNDLFEHPSTMLRAEFGVVPYLFREHELTQSLNWCESPDRFSVRYMEAIGGAGKTRFAIELCRCAASKGWVSGMMPRQSRGVSSVPLPRLVAVDYVDEGGALDLVAELSSLCVSATDMSPVRVLLLSRPTRGAGRRAAIEAVAEQQLAVGALLRALEKALELADPVVGLTAAQRQELYAQALSAFGRGAVGQAWAPVDGLSPDLSQDHFAQPLDVLFEAFDTALTNDVQRDTTRPAIERVLSHEEKYWHTRSAPIDDELARRCVALATLAGARNKREARKLMSVVPELANRHSRRAVDSWLAALYPGDGYWNPLRPDRLGEALVDKALHEGRARLRHLLDKVLRLESDLQVERTLEVLARLSSDKSFAVHLRPVLLRRYGALADRCQRQTRGSEARVGATGLLDGLMRLHMAVIGSRTLPDLTMIETEKLVPGLNIIRELARQFARSSDYITLTNQYHHLCRKRVEEDNSNPAYLHDLANSYDNLGDLDANAGRSVEARRRYETCLRLRYDLVAHEPDNSTYQSELSDSYNRLGDLATSTGRMAEAEKYYRKALVIGEDVVDRHPDCNRYHHDLSNCYNNLGDLAFNQGYTDEAKTRYEQARRIAEDLVAREPGTPTYQQDLSNAYNNLGDLASSEGRIDEAKTRYDQARRIAKALIAREPDNATYQHDLSNSYNNLGDLATALEYWPAAKKHYQRALRIAENLLASEPENLSYKRDISVSYQNLGSLAAARKLLSEAEYLLHEVLRIAVELTSSEPENITFGRDLADAYSNLGNLALEAQRSTDAHGHYRRAYEITLGLLARQPNNAACQRDLMNSCIHLGDITIRSGDRVQAWRVYGQALRIAKRLVAQDPESTIKQRELAEASERVAKFSQSSRQT